MDVERLFLPVVMHRIVFTPSYVATARELGWQEARERFPRQCLEIAPPPGGGARSPRARAARDRAVTATTFPLIPRRRVLGLPFGALHSARRGLGSDVAGSRPYQPGDDIDRIDWYASARLSLARGSDEFVVREHFAEEAPRVVSLVDRRPSMSIFPEGWPWLQKPEAIRGAVRLISDSAIAARGLLGYLDEGEGDPFWHPPRSQHLLGDADLERPFEAPADTLDPQPAPSRRAAP